MKKRLFYLYLFFSFNLYVCSFSNLAPKSFTVSSPDKIEPRHQELREALYNLTKLANQYRWFTDDERQFLKFEYQESDYDRPEGYHPPHDKYLKYSDKEFAECLQGLTRILVTKLSLEKNGEIRPILYEDRRKIFRYTEIIGIQKEIKMTTPYLNLDKVQTIYYPASGNDFSVIEQLKPLFPNLKQIVMIDPIQEKSKKEYDNIKVYFEKESYLSSYQMKKFPGQAIFICKRPGESGFIGAKSWWYEKIASDMNFGDYLIVTEAFINLDNPFGKYSESFIKIEPMDSGFTEPNSYTLRDWDGSAISIPNHKWPNGGWLVYQKTSPALNKENIISISS